MAFSFVKTIFLSLKLLRHIHTHFCRRFPKRIYVQPPDTATCIVLLKKLLTKQNCSLTEREIEHLARYVQHRYSVSGDRITQS